MFLKDISFHSPAANILYDEVLLQLADVNDSGDVLRLWESPDLFVVLGRTSRLEDDVRIDAVQQDQLPVLRRFSGGGTVLQGKGCLNFSLILSKIRYPGLKDIRQSYREILDPIVLGLRQQGIPAGFRPASDLAWEGSEQKFSGNAQHRGRHYILHHGTILYDFDLSLISQYLLMPKDFPPYRARRNHADFLINLPLPAATLRQVLCEVCHVEQATWDLTQEEKEKLDELLQKRMESVRVMGEIFSGIGQ